jgi:very-short-patch-repair endonuclease
VPTYATTRSRQLRADSTRAETGLWRLLKGRGVGGLKFRRQHPINRFFADFACLEAKLMIEIDGKSHSGREEEDAARTLVLENCGFQVLRFTNSDVMFGRASVRRRILEAAGLGLELKGS